MNLLAGKRVLITGVANKRSIAWGIAKTFAEQGAQLVLTYQTERFREHIEALLPELGATPLLVPLDASSDSDVLSCAERLRAHFGALDVFVHSMAFAPSADLVGRFYQTSREGFRITHDVSVYSLIALSAALLPLFEEAGGGSIITMSYLGAQRAMPNYKVMGVAKAALESTVRYLADDLGPSQVRVNAISAGPIKTLAASGVKGLSTAIGLAAEKSPLRRSVSAADVGQTAAFLASDFSRMLTGQVLFVDAGYHIVGS